MYYNIRDFKQWTVRREAELEKEEERKLKDEHTEMKNKIQSDIDLVKRKLKEEKMEEKQQMKFDMAEKQLVRNMSFVYPIQTYALCVKDLGSSLYVTLVTTENQRRM